MGRNRYMLNINGLTIKAQMDFLSDFLLAFF